MIRLILHTFAAKLINAVLNFMLVVLTARELGAAIRGDISLLVATLYIFVLISGFVGGSAVIYLAPRYSKGQILRLGYLWAMVVACVLVPLSAWLFELPAPQLVHWIVLSLLFNLSAINRYMLIAIGKIKADNAIGIAVNLLQLGVLWLLLQIGYAPAFDLFLYAFYAAWLLAFGLSFILLSKQWQLDQSSPWRLTWNKLWSYGALAQGANLAQFLGYRIQYYLIGLYLTKADIGVFSVAVALSESLWMITQSISLVQLSHIANHKNGESTAAWSLQLMKFSIALTLLGLTVLLLLPDQWFPAFFGTEFGQLKPLIWRLAPGILALSGSNILVHYFAGNGKLAVNLFISVLTLLLVVTSNAVLMALWGLNGAAWAASLAYGLAAVFILLYFMRKNQLAFRLLLPKGEDFALVIKAFKNIKAIK